MPSNCLFFVASVISVLAMKKALKVNDSDSNAVTFSKQGEGCVWYFVQCLYDNDYVPVKSTMHILSKVGSNRVFKIFKYNETPRGPTDIFY